MDQIIEYLKKFKEVYSVLVLVIGLIISTYTGYTNIINSIESGAKKTEVVQITMLKSITRAFEENHKCRVSQAEWDEYLLNYSTLFDLKIKHNMLSKVADWKPIERKMYKCKEEL